jgi:hypothetical protein
MLETARIIDQMKDERDRRLRLECEFLAWAASNGAVDQFTCGSTLRFECISPQIQ